MSEASERYRRRIRTLRRSPLLSRRQWARRLAFWIGAVLVGLVAIGFARAANWADGLFHRALTVSPYLALVISPLGLALSVTLTRTAFQGAQGSGIPQVIASLHTHRPETLRRVLSLKVAFGKVVLTTLGLASGASVGREGPTVQVGASLMQALGRALKLPRLEESRALVLAGGAAGIAAAFNTPLAGIVFAIEELSHSFESRTSGTVLTAVIVAGLTTLALVGNYPYFGITSAAMDTPAHWLAVPVAAVVGGLAGGVFSQILIVAGRGIPGRTGRLIGAHPVLFAAFCGLLIALFGLLSGGATYGTGYAEARELVRGHPQAVPFGFSLMKMGATLASYLSGIPGGIFAPSLSIGAGIGRTLARLLIPGLPTAPIVLIGMVAYFSGVVQAPITAAVIVMEMTDNQQMTVPLMLTSFLAFAASRLVCRRPLYGALAAGFLRSVEQVERQVPGPEPLPVQGPLS